MAVITISRQYGSGGDEIAIKLAERLGYEHVNKELISEIARRAKVPETEVERLDERGEGAISRFLSKLFSSDRYLSYLGTAYWEMSVPCYLESCAPDMGFLNREDYLKFIEAAISDLYRRGNVVIVGRGGQVILKDKPGVVHVRVVAPLNARVRRVAVILGVSEEEAARIVKERERCREEFLRQMFGIDPNDPTLYHLVINTGAVEEWKSVELIASLVGG